MDMECIFIKTDSDIKVNCVKEWNKGMGSIIILMEEYTAGNGKMISDKEMEFKEILRNSSNIMDNGRTIENKGREN